MTAVHVLLYRTEAAVSIPQQNTTTTTPLLYFFRHEKFIVAALKRRQTEVNSSIVTTYSYSEYISCTNQSYSGPMTILTTENGPPEEATTTMTKKKEKINSSSSSYFYHVKKTVAAVAIVMFAILWQYTITTSVVYPTDPQVAQLSDQFERLLLNNNNNNKQTSGTTDTASMNDDDSYDDNNYYYDYYRGYLNWDQDTFLWNWFCEKFGSNPNTPYMYNVLPIVGGKNYHNWDWWQWFSFSSSSFFISFLPSPMWRLYHHDIVVLLAKQPPNVDYFSLTTFCLWSQKRGFVFASLGDSLNSFTMKKKMNKTTTTKENHNNNQEQQQQEQQQLFAHVVVTESSGYTLNHIQELLQTSGLSKDDIYVAVVPNELINDDSYALFEVVMRLFRFQNQTDGNSYLNSKQPVFYIHGERKERRPLPPEQKLITTTTTIPKKKKDEEEEGEPSSSSSSGSNPIITLLPKPTYKERAHDDNVNERSLLQHDFNAYQERIIANISEIYYYDSKKNNKDWRIQSIPFGPLYIRGLDCIHNYTECLGDCPDAAYFGSHIQDHTDHIPSLMLTNNDELHVLTMVDHRRTKASIYSSIALLLSPNGAVLNKTHMNVRATSLGILSNIDFMEENNDHTIENNNHKEIDSDDKIIPDEETNTGGGGGGGELPFLAWIFTRNADHCSTLSPFVQGCTVLDEREVPRKGYFAYCERLYLNPVTGTGPDWNNIVTAQLYHLRNLLSNNKRKEDDEAAAAAAARRYEQNNLKLFGQLRLPSSNVPLTVFQGEEKLRFLHILKTGGEAFEAYLGTLPANSGVPQIDYQSCRRASMINLTASTPAIANTKCWAVATTIGTILCALNCECCASDMYEEGRFHGTMLRSPRSYTVSIFTHGHNAHHTTWERSSVDVPLYLVERVLSGAEYLCGHSGTGGVKDWKIAFEDNLKTSLSSWPPGRDNEWDDGVQVISLRNPQSHALTCGKKEKGSLGQHFRVLTEQKQGQASNNPPSSAVDSLEPNLDAAFETLHRMEWIGITDLYHPSLCLLHYQTNQTLPAKDCDCRHKDHHTNDKTTKPLGQWVEYRNKKKNRGKLSSSLLNLIDANTSVDAKLFVEALRLVLGRLRRVEELTGTSLLECIDWQKLKQETDYLPGLWTGGPDSLLSTS